MNYLLTIIGPTAIGKTALSIELAKYFNCEIISCDSRQFYKEMEIGTAVPSNIEKAEVPHHFIQNKSIHEIYTVGDYEKDAVLKLDSLFETNSIQIMVGGSGLYMDAVLYGFDDFPQINSNVRDCLNVDFEKFGMDYLQENLKEADPIYYNYLEQNNPQTLLNPQRMKRFVEVCRGTGKPYSSFLNKNKTKRNFTPILIGLEAERAIIYEKINLRVDIMIKEGLVDEVKSLLPYKSLNPLNTVGYSELFAFLKQETTLDNAIEEIKKNTRRFSKRQLTWFKRNEGIVWFDYKEDVTTIINHIKAKF
jgi:tRNA dimethylallyltransferase